MHTLIRHVAIFQALLIALMLVPSGNANPSEQTGGEVSSSPRNTTRPRQTAEVPSEPLKVGVVDAPILDKESQEVLDALQKLLHGLEQGNLEVVAACLSDNVTQIDKQSKVMFGKPEVLENVKKNIIGTNNKRPVKRIMVYSPFIRVKGDTAMVSFRATKEMAGPSPSKLESWCSEVFERKDGQWLVLQLRTNWKSVN